MWPRLEARDAVVLVITLLAGVLVAILIVQPFTAPQVAYDTGASTLYFRRLVAGELLEAYVATTPKPLMTLLNGVLHAVGGWTAVAWVALAIHGLVAGLAGVIADRIAGPIAAGWVAASVIGNPFLLEEASFATALPVAVALWCVAALVVSQQQPHWGVAGTALLLATLARLETLVVVAVVAATLTIAPVVERHPRGLREGALRSIPRRAWLLVFLPPAALPIMLVHDGLLTGDPFFWLTVSERYTEQVRAQSALAGPIEVAVSLGHCW